MFDIHSEIKAVAISKPSIRKRGLDPVKRRVSKAIRSCKREDSTATAKTFKKFPRSFEEKYINLDYKMYFGL